MFYYNRSKVEMIQFSSASKGYQRIEIFYVKPKASKFHHSKLLKRGCPFDTNGNPMVEVRVEWNPKPVHRMSPNFSHYPRCSGERLVEWNGRKKLWNQDKWGCIHPIDSKTTFVPKLWLFIGGNEYKELKEDFVVIETEGNPEFIYSKTLTCNHSVLTWKKVNSSAKLQNVGREDWHHIFFNEYVPCEKCSLYTATDCYKKETPIICKYDTNVNNEPDYDILGKNQDNVLMFCSESKGFYFFKARVIDPTLSFCELSTEFAIEILGTTYSEHSPIPYIVTMVFAVLSVGLIIGASYYRFTGIFRKHMAIHYKRQDAALEEMQRLRNESRTSQTLMSRSVPVDHFPTIKRFSHQT